MALNSGKLYILAFTALFLLSLAACKRREDPVVHGNDPVFYTDILMSSGKLKQTAGQGDYYMYSSYAIDTAGLLHVTGEIKSVKCADCIGYFTFSFSNTGLGSIFDDSTLQPGPQRFHGPSGIDTVYNVTFDATTSGGFVGGAPSYGWDFNDGGTQNTPNPVITHQYQDSGIYHPTLTADNGTCVSVLTGRVHAKDAPDPCKSIINIDTGGVNEFKLKAIATGPGTFQYKWFFFGLSSADSTSTSDSFYKVLPVDSAVRVRLITTSVGCTDSTYATINSASTVTKPAKSCYANFRTTISPVTIPAGTPFKKVTVTYNDTTGKKYISSLFDQPVTSSFVIHSVKEYDRNEKNQKTRQVVIEFNCRLFFTQTDFIDVSGTGVIAVAYP